MVNYQKKYNKYLFKCMQIGGAFSIGQKIMYNDKEYTITAITKKIHYSLRDSTGTTIDVALDENIQDEQQPSPLNLGNPHDDSQSISTFSRPSLSSPPNKKHHSHQHVSKYGATILESISENELPAVISSEMASYNVATEETRVIFSPYELGHLVHINDIFDRIDISDETKLAKIRAHFNASDIKKKTDDLHDRMEIAQKNN